MTKLREIFKDHFGKKMGMITIFEKFKKVANAKNFRYLVYFKCDCGKTGYICPRAAIKRKDCGCQSAIKRWAKRGGHRKTGTPIYQTHQSMMNRCYNKNVKSFARYGGRGIKVCKEWHNFKAFYRDMGDKPGEE